MAAGDRDGVINQIERLADLEGLADAGLDVDELDELAEGLDENAVDDLIAEFQAIDCDLETPEVEAPVDTEPADTVSTTETATTEIPPTEPTADTIPSTEPAPTTPTTEASPDPTVTPEDTVETPPGADSGSIPVDVGSTGPGPALGLDRPTEAVLAEFGYGGILYSPNTNIAELRVSRTENTFSDDLQWSAFDSITMSATTPLTLEEVRAAYRTAIENLGFEYEYTESTSSTDGTTTVGLEAVSPSFEAGIPRWDITVTQSDDAPGTTLIEVGQSVDRPGPLPPIPPAAQDALQPTADIGTGLGWTVTGYRWSELANTFSGGTSVFATVEWYVSEDNTVRETATMLQDAVGLPIRDEEVEDERITWFLDDDSSTLFAVNYFEFGGTTASFNP